MMRKASYDAKTKNDAANNEVVTEKRIVIVPRILRYFENDLKMLQFHQKLRLSKPSDCSTAL